MEHSGAREQERELAEHGCRSYRIRKTSRLVFKLAEAYAALGAEEAVDELKRRF